MKENKTKPDIRFKGFTDDWEQRKLNEIVGIYDGVHQTPKYQDSGIMFLSVENISTLQSTKYISEEDFKRDYKVYPQENDILMTRIGDVGTTNVVTDNSLKAYYVSLALLKYKNTNPYFLSNAMQSNYVQKGLANRTLKTAVPMILNERWMIVVRFAFRPVPMDANTAVIQVPIFCPNSTYTAPEKEIAPLVASA